MTQSMGLNSQSPVPLYHQLAEILMARIQSGIDRPGGRIPAETALAERYGIGRPTVRQAVEILVRKGLVKRRRGAGTFVTDPKDEVDLFSLAGTSSAFLRKKIAIETQILEPVTLADIPPDPDNPFSGQRAYTLLRVTHALEKPVLLERVYLHREWFKGIEQIDMAGQSLARIVSDRFYMVPACGRQTFRVTALSRAQADLLGMLPEDPVLLVKRSLDFPQAKNAVYAEMLCPTDRFVFSQTIGGDVHD